MHHPTVAYWPQGNGMFERANSNIIRTLRELEAIKKGWAKMLPEAIFKLNRCVHCTTGLSPFYLVYGFHPPIDKELTIGRTFEDTSLLQKECNLQIA
uniref:Integrase catalytic domain-containing protein n=1 Tax=Strigamia maritima TaxID=126957 RepID=T1JPB6_STRMM